MLSFLSLPVVVAMTQNCSQAVVEGAPEVQGLGEEGLGQLALLSQGSPSSPLVFLLQGQAG